MAEKFIIGKKIGMTQVFKGKQGEVVPVTVIEAGPCKIIEIIEKEKRGYTAVKVCYGKIKEKKVKKPIKGYFLKKKVEPASIIKEFRVEDLEKYKEGEDITVSTFKEGEKVVVTGQSKGKGFQGTIKRWNFSGGPKSHGSKSHRLPGAIGEHTYPGEVRKGKKMAGHLGDEKVTVKNLDVVKIDEIKNLIMLKGAVPGANNGFVVLRSIN